jgi:beta-glucosidase
VHTQVIYGDGKERWQRSDDDSALMRKTGAQSIVLLKNKNNVLPIKAEGIKKVAIIGPNAKATVISGGGSASLRASYIITPYEAIVASLPKGVEVVYHEGCAGM